ncbi:hypothetical protein ACFFJI_04480 [Allobacillus sp. GCM10007491]|uniref:Uncharacterized protein n=1 Tax=Allobacillus saliphilus TaxID=2912308 RepID=A0A941CX35_9BACI|nr:hypothetical protein [Allobacillus saliphilus]MBR7554774.1 hypothetical protein [Allobacillus saliphilus]
MTFNILSRLSIALAAFLFTYIANLLFSDMSLQAANDYLSNPLHWIVFTFYLIGVSFLIDWIFRKINETSTWSYVSAYTLAGIVIWAVLFITVLFDSFSWYFFVVIYSSIYTVLGFIVFYLFLKVFRMNVKKILMIGIPSLIAILFIVFTNPAIKSGFSSTYEANTYYAEFDNFNGEEPVWIPVEEGQEYEITIDWKLKNSAQHGLRVSPEVHEMGELTIEEDESISYEAAETGELLFFFHGINIEGEIMFTWEEI